MIRIVIAEDHQIVREGITTLLERHAGCAVVGQAGDGREAVAVVREEDPDVLVVDLSMPELNGLEVIRRIRDGNDEVGILVLSMHDEIGYVARSLEAGAEGYLVKEDTTVHLVEAVEAVAKGREFFSAAVRARLDRLGESDRDRLRDPVETLTDREREILQLVAEGHTSKQIAERLYISPRTVDTHRANLMEKLDLENKTHLIRYAIGKGIVSVE